MSNDTIQILMDDAVAILKQIKEDVELYETSQDEVSFIERMQVNRDDIDEFLQRKEKHNV